MLKKHSSPDKKDSDLENPRVSKPQSWTHTVERRGIRPNCIISLRSSRTVRCSCFAIGYSVHVRCRIDDASCRNDDKKFSTCLPPPCPIETTFCIDATVSCSS